MRLQYIFSPRKIALFLACIAVYFALQSLIMEYLIENVLDPVSHSVLIQLIDLFSVNTEQTIPTWYSVLLLFVAAVILANLAAAHRAQHAPFVPYWVGLALIFLYLSIDEGAVIHEIASDALQTFGAGYLTFPWLIVAAPLVIGVGLLYLRFLWHLPRRIRLLFILAGVIYIGGAMGIEAVSANHYSLGGGVTFPYLVIATAEELCEMLGVIVFIYALLSYAVEKHYSFAAVPTSSPAIENASAIESVYPAITTRFIVRFGTFLVVILIGANAALVTWALSQPATSQAEQEKVRLQVIIDQFPSDDVVMLRMIGRFGGDNLAARQVVAGLLNIYEDVLVITLPTMESSIAFAADELPFDRDMVIEMLHGVGQTQFVIFDTPAVRVFVGNLAAPR